MKIPFSELNIYEIEKFQKKVLKDLEKAKSSFTLNFENVETIDLNSIQFIISIKKYCVKNNIDLKITNLKSKKIKQTFHLFNIPEILGITL